MPLTAIGITMIEKDLPGFWQFCASFALTESLTQGLKYSVNATRPNGGKLSFPSGHTSAAFCSAVFFNMRYGENYGIPAFVCASITGWSRIESSNHFPWDVAAGAAIGIAGNLYVTKKKKDNLLILPLIDEHGVGALLQCKF